MFQLIERNFRDDKRARKTNRIEAYAHAHLITQLNLFYYLAYYILRALPFRLFFGRGHKTFLKTKL